jgi:ubiquinone/menaquinone biosynthesis C-methylase UbiE
MTYAPTPNIGPTQTKYADRNPITRFAISRFFRTLESLLADISYDTVLEAGSGEGEVMQRLINWTDASLTGFDIDDTRVRLALDNGATRNLIVADLHAMPFPAECFDLVMMLEVLEHVGMPQIALREAHRVTRHYVLASVPHEPWWRIGNMLRLKYLREFGNTPEHINHWSLPGFLSLMRSRFTVLRIRLPFLWQFILAERQPGT